MAASIRWRHGGKQPRRIYQCAHCAEPFGQMKKWFAHFKQAHAQYEVTPSSCRIVDNTGEEPTADGAGGLMTDGISTAANHGTDNLIKQEPDIPGPAACAAPGVATSAIVKSEPVDEIEPPPEPSTSFQTDQRPDVSPSDSAIKTEVLNAVEVIIADVIEPPPSEPETVSQPTAKQQPNVSSVNSFRSFLESSDLPEEGQEVEQIRQQLQQQQKQQKKSTAVRRRKPVVKRHWSLNPSAMRRKLHFERLTVTKLKRQQIEERRQKRLQRLKNQSVPEVVVVRDAGAGGDAPPVEVEDEQSVVVTQQRGGCRGLFITHSKQTTNYYCVVCGRWSSAESQCLLWHAHLSCGETPLSDHATGCPFCPTPVRTLTYLRRHLSSWHDAKLCSGGRRTYRSTSTGLNSSFVAWYAAVDRTSWSAFACVKDGCRQRLATPEQLFKHLLQQHHVRGREINSVLLQKMNIELRLTENNRKKVYIMPAVKNLGRLMPESANADNIETNPGCSGVSDFIHTDPESPSENFCQSAIVKLEVME